MDVLMSLSARHEHQARAPAQGRPAPHIPPRRTAAHRIANDAEAIAVAHDLARGFAAGAADRDRDRRLPIAELDAYSDSGLLGITVPKAYGGAGVSNVTLSEVTAIISAADGSLGQIPQNHLYMVEASTICSHACWPANGSAMPSPRSAANRRSLFKRA
jgi:alkylation response protein AidB-like acyl-CoA dehydrogenase